MSNLEDGQLLEQVTAAFCARTNDGAGWQTLPWLEQVVLFVYGAQGVIDNGGLVYFYENDWPGNPPYVLFTDAYAAIGAEQMANCIRETAVLFAFPQPHLDVQKRNEYLKTLGENAAGVFMQCDDFAVGQGEDVFTRLAAFVREQGLSLAN